MAASSTITTVRESRAWRSRSRRHRWRPVQRAAVHTGTLATRLPTARSRVRRHPGVSAIAGSPALCPVRIRISRASIGSLRPSARLLVARGEPEGGGDRLDLRVSRAGDGLGTRPVRASGTVLSTEDGVVASMARARLAEGRWMLAGLLSTGPRAAGRPSPGLPPRIRWGHTYRARRTPRLRHGLSPENRASRRVLPVVTRTCRVGLLGAMVSGQRPSGWAGSARCQPAKCGQGVVSGLVDVDRGHLPVVYYDCSVDDHASDVARAAS